jgi:hypothetical protein
VVDDDALDKYSGGDVFLKMIRLWVEEDLPFFFFLFYFILFYFGLQECV